MNFKGSKGDWAITYKPIPGFEFPKYRKGVINCFAPGTTYVRKNIGCIYAIQKEEQKKNAQLIVAAPELLKQLQNLIHLHTCEQEGIGSGQPTPKEWMEAVDKAHEAVLKAIGDGILLV